MKLTDEKIYSPGLEGVLAGESAICQVDEGDSGLRYRGYAIEDLAEGASFEEVAYLLLFGTLPTNKELERFAEQIVAEWALPDPMQEFIDHVPPDAHPMDVLRTGVSVLGMTDPEAADHSHDANARKAIRLLAQIPLLITSAYRHTLGKPAIAPKMDGDYADNLLFLLTERQGDDMAHAMARLLNVSLILYAEHEFNASTFAARVTASTMTDLHSAITAAIGTLKGPLHGGANEAVAAMFCEIATPDRAERWVRDALASKRRVMGFGHRVLKRGDPRSLIIQRQAQALSRICGDIRWYEMATTIDRIMHEEKGLYPNLDFYTAVSYLLIGIPRELYTPVFVCSRITGWCAHVIEQQDHNRLIRPRALYTGPPPQAYVAIDRRA
jgi:2-methylcitrate synthase/citrate synthase II